MNDSKICNLSGEEWKALRNLADDRSILIMGFNKCSSVVVQNRDDYLQEASRQLWDTNIYEDLKFNVNIRTSLFETRSETFHKLCGCKLIPEKKLKYFTYSFQKTTYLGKLLFLPMIRKGLSFMSGRQVLSNYGTATDKASEYLDNVLKSVTQESQPYIKDSGIFFEQCKTLWTNYRWSYPGYSRCVRPLFQYTSQGYLRNINET